MASWSSSRAARFITTRALRFAIVRAEATFGLGIRRPPRARARDDGPAPAASGIPTMSYRTPPLSIQQPVSSPASGHRKPVWVETTAPAWDSRRDLAGALRRDPAGHRGDRRLGHHGLAVVVEDRIAVSWSGRVVDGDGRLHVPLDDQGVAEQVVEAHAGSHPERIRIE